MRVCAGSVLLQLFHSVKCAAGFKPLDLGLIEGVIQHDCFLAPIRMLDDAFQGLLVGRKGGKIGLAFA